MSLDMFYHSMVCLVRNFEKNGAAVRKKLSKYASSAGSALALCLNIFHIKKQFLRKLRNISSLD